MVRNLKVVGQVIPSGVSETIDGIAGINYGKLVGCSFEGAVEGKDSVGGLVGINETTEHYVGGIAGQNTGSLIQCENDGEINTTAVEAVTNLPDISLLGTTESVPAGTDIGGIAGFSSGVIQSCVTHLNTVLELAQKILNGDQSTETIDSLLTELNAAGADAQSAKISLDSAVSHAAAARENLTAMGEAGAAAMEDVNAATSQLDPALTCLTTAIDQVNQIVSTLSNQPTISFTPVDSNVTNQGDMLDAALSQMITNANSLSSNLTSASDTLIGDMQAMNNQLGVIIDLVQQEMEDTKDKNAADSFEDISDEASGDPASGKLNNAVNSGSVQGDVNVAGIVGSMSVEYDFDPEDDLTEDGSRSLNFQYRTLSVVTDCTNEGSVEAKKDFAGGIVGAGWIWAQ